jgi:hypothetical protein
MVQNDSREEGPDEGDAGKHFDLSGEWPRIRSTVWDGDRYVSMEKWNSLTAEETAQINEWMSANGREIRETWVNGAARLMHYPLASDVFIDPEDEGRIELFIRSDAIRHSNNVIVTVVGGQDAEQSEIVFLEWLADLVKVLEANDGAFSDRTA